jgi:DNA-binding MarR family transcriptional regulator
LASIAPLSKALRRIEDTAAARAGLSMWQYAILSTIDDVAGMNQRQVAARLQYSPNRIVADLDTMERRGLITRQRDADRRANTLRITAEGRQLQRQVHDLVGEQEQLLLAGLTGAERRELRRIIERLADQLRPMPPAGR